MSSGKLLRRLLELALEYRRPCLAVVVMQGMLVWLSLSTLGLTGLGIDYLQSCVLKNAEAPKWPFGWTPPESWAPMTVVTALSLAIFAVAVMTAGLKYLAAIASGALSQQILIRMRTEIYSKLQVLGFQFYDAGESSSIINRAAGDANNVRNFIDGVIIRLITVILTLTVYLVYMMRMHPLLTLACLATTPFLWAMAVVFSTVVQPAYRRASELGDVMIRTLVENLQGIQVVKAFARESEQAKKFEAANHDIRDLKNSIFFRLSTFQPAMGLLTQINMLVLIAYGGSLVVRGELALGAGLFVFANLLHEFANQVAHITNIANSIQSSLASAERVFEVLDQPVLITSPENPVALPVIRKAIEFDHVSFGYRPDQLVLKDISLRIECGECIGVTGPTGAGKSTLISLLKRFYDVSSGTLKFDGHDVRSLNLDDVRRSSGIVFQESFLFSNTIAANIAFGNPDADDEQIREAARLAAAHEFISELPLQYETIVGEHGSNLSGGQRQRLALARALLTSPSLLLLDDATAAVDPETEHEIRMALESTMRGRTCVVVSNRLSTLRQTDRIVVLNSGRIEAVGTHDELMESCDYYRALAKLQGAPTEPATKRRRLAVAS
ncbi:MAG: ABC transporter ATP-binding protein [Planctomycetaceae bacterium]|nr:ABC transporter ATP-binding protein [Planctomycetaceae bacterium]